MPFINEESFENEYNKLNNNGKEIVENFIAKCEDKTHREKLKLLEKVDIALRLGWRPSGNDVEEIVNNFNSKLKWQKSKKNVIKVIQNYLNNVYKTKNRRKNYINYSGLPPKYLKTKEEKKFNNRMHHLYRGTKDIFTMDVWNKSKENQDIITNIKNASPDDAILQELRNPERFVFDNWEEAEKQIKALGKCVIKPESGLNADNVFIFNGDGTIFDVKTRKPYTGTIDSIKKLYNSNGIKKIVIEENIMTDKNKKEQIVPYKFYCATGKVFCCRIGFGYYKIPPFDIRKPEFDEIYLNENMEDFKYAKDDGKIKPEEREKFDKLTCDKDTYQKMWHMAEKLSEKYPSMRVDLFCVKQPEKDKNDKDVYKIYFNELQRNSEGTFQCFNQSLVSEAFEEYNKMMHFREIPDENLTLAGRIIKNIDIKEHEKVLEEEKKKQIKEEEKKKQTQEEENKQKQNLDIICKNKDINNQTEPLGTDVNKNKKVIDKN